MKKVSVPLIKRAGNFIVKDSTTVCMLLGTSAATQSLHMYNARREKGVWIIPHKSVVERIQKTEERIASMQSKVDIMRQLVVIPEEGTETPEVE